MNISHFSFVCERTTTRGRKAGNTRISHNFLPMLTNGSGKFVVWKVDEARKGKEEKKSRKAKRNCCVALLLFAGEWNE